jgi:hypothetical protein
MSALKNAGKPGAVGFPMLRALWFALLGGCAACGGGSGTSDSNSLPPPPGSQTGDHGVVELITLGHDGMPANGNTFFPAAISADGRYVAFQSEATNLVTGPGSGFADIYLRDTCRGAPAGCNPSTIRISVADDGSLPNGNSRAPAISADGRFVAFDSSASNPIRVTGVF